MRELIYTLLELSKESKKTCDFCSNLHGEDNKPVKQIVIRVKSTSRWISDDVVCEDCQEKFLNDELPKCERCGRLQTKGYKDFFSGKYTCYCVSFNEDLEEKELPLLPGEEISQSAFYERQINGLREELDAAEVEIDTHLEALEISKDWHKRQKQELLDRIKELETEVERLKKQTPQELLDEISKLKDRVKQLEEQNNQLTAKVEVKTDKKLRFLPFGRKS